MLAHTTNPQPPDIRPKIKIFCTEYGQQCIALKIICFYWQTFYMHIYNDGGLIQDYQLLVLQEGESDMFQYFSAILCVHFRNSREGKSTFGVGNPCAPHPLNKSLHETCIIIL